jgi:hypothetical protein
MDRLMKEVDSLMEENASLKEALTRIAALSSETEENRAFDERECLQMAKEIARGALGKT